KRVYYVEAFAVRSYGEFKIAQGYITIASNQTTGVANFSVRFNAPGEIYTKVKVYDTNGKLLVQRQGLYPDRIDFSLPAPTINSIKYTTLPLYVNENENLEVVLEERSFTNVNRNYYLEVYAVRSNGEWKIATGYLTIPSGRSTATKNFTVRFNSPGSIYTKIKVYDGSDGRFLTQRQGNYPDNIQSQVTSQPSGTVPYYNQYENYAYPGSTCNLTSVAMMLDYFGITKPGINTGGWSRTPDYLISRFGGPIYDASGLDWAFNTIAKEKGSSVRMYTKLGTVSDMRAELAKGRPIIVQGWYTRSGHVLVVISFDGTYYICNDPAGTWNQYKYGGYVNRMGKYVKYYKSYFEEASIDDGDGLILFHYFR
ncbi:MAG: C39 family peptidase, partial [Fervidobacterium pennivorans]